MKSLRLSNIDGWIQTYTGSSKRKVKNRDKKYIFQELMTDVGMQWLSKFTKSGVWRKKDVQGELEKLQHSSFCSISLKCPL